MNNMKKVLKIAVLVLVLAVLLIPSINPFLNAEGKAEMSAKLQETFGTLSFTGPGFGNLLFALAAVVAVWLVSILLCWLLEVLAKVNKKSQSMVGLFSSLIKFVCGIVAIVWALSILGVNLAGIFASLGIASLIIGFGAQSLIEDAVTGIFIIFEGQYKVGDIIVLDDFRGTVKRIGIRTTAIEDAGGNLKVVNNSDIRNMQNRSRNNSVAVSDLCISYDAKIAEVEAVLAETLPKIYENHKNLYLTMPRYVGVESLGESSVVLRIIADVTEENFYVGYRTLNRELKLMCDEHNIEIPFNQLVIHQG